MHIFRRTFALVFFAIQLFAAIILGICSAHIAAIDARVSKCQIDIALIYVHGSSLRFHQNRLIHAHVSTFLSSPFRCDFCVFFFFISVASFISMRFCIFLRVCQFIFFILHFPFASSSCSSSLLSYFSARIYSKMRSTSMLHILCSKVTSSSACLSIERSCC